MYLLYKLKFFCSRIVQFLLDFIFNKWYNNCDIKEIASYLSLSHSDNTLGSLQGGHPLDPRFVETDFYYSMLE